MCRCSGVHSAMPTSRSTRWLAGPWPALHRASCRWPTPVRKTKPPKRLPMIKTTISISNKLGLHARASAKFTKLAGGFQSEVFMSRNGRRVNAKSIMGVMMLAAGVGSEVEIETSGADEQAAMNALCQLINDRFGEDE